MVMRRRSGADGNSDGRSRPFQNLDKSRSNPLSRTIAIAALLTAFGISLVLLARFHYSPQEWHFPAGLDGETIDSSHGGWPRFRLHPEDHSFRPATTITQKWTVTSGLRRPDGVLKQVYLIDDAFPGPTLEARSGDRIVIEVENALPDNETLSIHWHGLSMRGCNDQDGAVGITQRPIASGQTFTYDFSIETTQHGTFWYHAHDGVQRADGLFGGLVVHKPSTVKPKWGMQDEYLLMVQDWYHRSAEDALDFYLHPGSFGNEPVPDSILVNGAGSFNCSDAVPARPLDCQIRTLHDLPLLELDHVKRNILRVVNVGAYAGVGLSLTDSLIAPQSVDGGNGVQSASARSVGFLHPGERVELRVEPTHENTTAVPLLKVTMDTTGFRYPNPSLTLVHDFPVRWIGTMNRNSHDTVRVEDHVDLQTLKGDRHVSQFLPQAADETIALYAITQKLARLDNTPHGFINNTYWQPQSSPPEPLIALDRERWDKHQLIPNVAYKPDAPMWLDIVLNNLDEESHPFHLHGYDFWVLSTYSSTYNWGSYNPFDIYEPPGGPYDVTAPLKKDTVLVPRRGYAVLRLRADNPGIWLFHCHVIWHLASGMAMALQVA